MQKNDLSGRQIPDFTISSQQKDSPPKLDQSCDPLADDHEPEGLLSTDLDEILAQLGEHRGKEFIGLPQKRIKSLDENTKGLRNLMLLAGAPGVGKTTLAVQLGIDIVRNNPDACFIFISLEMSRREMVARIMCSMAEMDWGTFMLGKQGLGLDENQLRKIGDARDELMGIGKRICILDSENFCDPTVDNILDNLETLRESSGAPRAFILIDYLQVFPITDSRGRKVNTDLEADKWRIGAMRDLRDRSDGAAVLVISELRKSNSDDGGFGKLANVMGAARGTYTPDIVFILEGNEGNQDGTVRCTLNIEKGRDGILRKPIELTFHYTKSKFTEVT